MIPNNRFTTSYKVNLDNYHITQFVISSLRIKISIRMRERSLMPKIVPLNLQSYFESQNWSFPNVSRPHNFIFSNDNFFYKTFIAKAIDVVL